MKELWLASWAGGPRALFWCACFDIPHELPSALCFDKNTISFLEIDPTILMDGQPVGKILVLRIKDRGATCVIESDVLSNCVSPEYDYPWDLLKFIRFESHVENGIECIDNMVIDKALITPANEKRTL